jgi:hypothetical protein
MTYVGHCKPMFDQRRSLPGGEQTGRKENAQVRVDWQRGERGRVLRQ